MRWSLATVVLVPRGKTAHASRDEQRHILDWAARTGFEGIEISPHWLNIADALDSELLDFRRAAASAGLAISGVNVNRCLFTRGSRAEAAWGQMRRAIDAASTLGAGLVTFSLSAPLDGSTRPVLRGCDIPEAERAQAAAGLSELALLAGRESIELSLELHDDGLLDTAEYCLDMVQRIGAANVGVNPGSGKSRSQQPITR